MAPQIIEVSGSTTPDLSLKKEYSDLLNAWPSKKVFAFLRAGYQLF